MPSVVVLDLEAVTWPVELRTTDSTAGPVFVDSAAAFVTSAAAAADDTAAYADVVAVVVVV